MRRTAIATAVAAVGCGVAAPPTAAAAPPGFPDVAAFAAVDPADHLTRYVRGGAGIGFTTPSGVHCSWGFSEDPDAHTDVRCSGNIPGIPAPVPDDARPGCAQIARSGGLAAATYLYVFNRHGGSACAPVPASLTVGEKISATNITCVVGAGEVTACIDALENHGFVLAPSGSWVF